MIKSVFFKFFRAEEGAVTVDWVVLTASVVSLGFIVGYVIWDNSGSVSRKVTSYMSAQTVVTRF